jgi:hypothetical protein
MYTVCPLSTEVSFTAAMDEYWPMSFVESTVLKVKVGNTEWVATANFKLSLVSS